ncbi:cullin-1-like [Apium graveolens]|uniref:cullin-1-like n=1 Tax=Apium graveolens TaxID=4045 RepID=UPI003D7B8F7B
MNEKKTIDFDSGWEIIQKGITKFKKILEDQTQPQFNSEDYMELYSTVYGMCTQNPPHDYCRQLYSACIFNYRVGVYVFCGKLKYCLLCERSMVNQEVKVKVMAAMVSSLINGEREGGQIQQALLKKVFDMFVKIGMR